MNEDLSIFLRLIVIAILAGVLGGERETAGKPAGLRTHILVGISAVLFVVIGEFMIVKYQYFSQLVRFDLAGLVGAVVTGISFLGTGMIVVSRRKNGVEGLTTAADILTTAAIGMLTGLERYVLAVGSTLIVFAVLRFAKLFEKKYLENEAENAAEPRPPVP